MARYTGTRGRDEFYGISGQDNRFLFRPGYLDGADIVSGSTALTDIDTLVLYRPDGATGSLNVQAGKFDQVRNIEVVELADPGIELTVSQQLAGSSQRGFLTISGSSGNDVVSGQPTDPSRGPVTTALVFNANGGADSFTGGEGDDRVRFADETRTGTTLDGRGGFDTLVYTGVGTFDFATLADVKSIERVELRPTDRTSQTVILNDAILDAGATFRSFSSPEGFGQAQRFIVDGRNVDPAKTIEYYGSEASDTLLITADALKDSVVFSGGDGESDTLGILNKSVNLRNFDYITEDELSNIKNIEAISIEGQAINLTLGDSYFGNNNFNGRAFIFTDNGYTSIDLKTLTNHDALFYIDTGTHTGFPERGINYTGSALNDYILSDNVLSNSHIDGRSGFNSFSLAPGFSSLDDPFILDGTLESLSHIRQIDFQYSLTDALVKITSGVVEHIGSSDFLIITGNSFTHLTSSENWVIVDQDLTNAQVANILGDASLPVGDTGRSTGVGQLIFYELKSGDKTLFASSEVDISDLIGPKNTFLVTTADDQNVESDDLAVETLDGGGLSLREAVHFANFSRDFDRILFDSSLKGGILNITSDISLTSYLEIDGDTDNDGSADIELSGGNENRIFLIDGADTALNNIIFSNGRAAQNVVQDYAENIGNPITLFYNRGGALYIIGDSNVEINNAVFSNNSAGQSIFTTIDGPNLISEYLVAGLGGAIYVESDSSVSITQSLFDKNSVESADNGELSFGGAIYNTGSLSIDDTVFSKNSANGAITIPNDPNLGFGGAITTDFPTSVTNINNSSFYYNTSGSGGAIRLNTDSIVSIKNSIFQENHSTTNGGAIRAFGSLSIALSEFYENSADLSGGAIDSATDTQVTSSLFDGNTATAGGAFRISGGTGHVDNSIFTGNQASGTGGSAVNVTGTDTHLDLLNVTITGNNSTVSDNYALTSLGDSQVSLANSILAGNGSGAGSGDFISQSIQSFGSNIIGTAIYKEGQQIDTTSLSEIFRDVGLNQHTNVLSGLLSDNGGAFNSVAILTGGSADGAGNTRFLPSDTLDLDNDGITTENAPFDGRGPGFDRLSGALLDLGAYQIQDFAAAIQRAVDSDVTVTTDGNAAADAFVSALQAQEAAKDDAPLELTQDLLLPAFFDVDEPVAPYSPIHGDLAQPHIA